MKVFIYNKTTLPEKPTSFCGSFIDAFMLYSVRYLVSRAQLYA